MLECVADYDVSALSRAVHHQQEARRSSVCPSASGTRYGGIVGVADCAVPHLSFDGSGILTLHGSCHTTCNLWIMFLGCAWVQSGWWGCSMVQVLTYSFLFYSTVYHNIIIRGDQGACGRRVHWSHERFSPSCFNHSLNNLSIFLPHASIIHSNSFVFVTVWMGKSKKCFVP